MNDTHVSQYPPLVNRDISWLYFNHRVLQEARDKDVPLLERLKFLGIYSNNLDEFYRVRMATQARVAELTGKKMAEEAGKARSLIARLNALDSSYSKEYERAVGEVAEDMDAAGIHIIDESQLTEDQAHFVRCYFRNKVSGFISPVWLSSLKEFARESDDHIYLAVQLDGPGMPTDYAVIELPTNVCGRFLTLPPGNDSARKETYVMYLDDVVRQCLPMIFPGMGYTSFKAYSLKFTKDAEMELDNDLHDGILQKVAKAVRSRKRGATMRVIYDSEMPSPLLAILMKKLRLDRFDTVKPSGRYHNHKDLMSFPDVGRPELLYPAWPPVIDNELKGTGSLLQLIWNKDRWIQVPYHTFDYVVRILQEAAVSKNVKSIKMSLYRVARDSKIVEALICAARNGKKVTAMVELLARFDESSNIHVAREMQEAGINVIFGVEGLKVHGKLVHIGMKKGRDIAIVGTGNFHEGNAKVYTDYFLMTARRKITQEVDRVFEFLRKPYRSPVFESLLVSPMSMRQQFLTLVDNEIKAARQGRKAYIKMKVNHVTDDEMCHKLYQAAMAGVKVDLLVRGNCSLVTTDPALKGNLTIRGIIDRYLEHARIFIFCADGADKTFIGSADWMPRNLDNRVEVVCPVDDPSLKADLRYTVETGLADTAKARIVDGSGMNLLPPPDADGRRLRSQEEIHNHYVSLEHSRKESAD